MRYTALLSFFAPLALASAQSVVLDPTFGTGGIVHHTIEPYYDKINGVAIQPDGKILVVGYSIAVNANWNIALVRYNEDGSFDSTFGNNGVVVTDIGPSHEEGHAVVVQPDGKILLAGYTWVVDPNGTHAFAVVARYLTDGTPDTSFGTGGITTTSTGYPADYAYAMALQPDGRIVLAGNSDNVDFAVLRLLPDGTPDSGFGISGWVEMNMPALFCSVRSVVVQPDERIVVAGEAMYYNTDSTNTYQDFALARLLPDGAMDLSFGTQGYVFTDLDGTGVRADAARAVVLQPDGKLIAGGPTVGNGGAMDVGLARYMPDGSLDPSFGNGGTVVTDFENSSQEVRGLHLMSDGRLLIGGHHYHDFAAMRYLADGTPDVSFDTDGLIHTEIDPLSYEYGNAIAVYPDGRILVAGETTFQCYQRKFALVRYTTDMSTAIGTEPGLVQDLSIVPNPAEYTITVALAELPSPGASWSLHDATGRSVASGRVPSGAGKSFTISLDGLAQGSISSRCSIGDGPPLRRW